VGQSREAGLGPNVREWVGQKHEVPASDVAGAMRQWLTDLEGERIDFERGQSIVLVTPTVGTDVVGNARILAAGHCEADKCGLQGSGVCEGCGIHVCAQHAYWYRDHQVLMCPRCRHTEES